jgi:hypothetical protein
MRQILEGEEMHLNRRNLLALAMSATAGLTALVAVETPAHADIGTSTVMFQANSDLLYQYTTPDNGHKDLVLGMAADTSPSCTFGSFAFQSTQGELWYHSTFTGTTQNLHIPVGASSSPSIAEWNSDAIAYQAPSTELYYYFQGSPIDTGQAMASGTSPSMVPDLTGNFEIAFQGDNGHLKVYNTGTGLLTDSGLGMAQFTSPSIALGFNAADPFEVAFQANGGHLWLWDPTTKASTNAELAMAQFTSPSIAVQNYPPTDPFRVALQANTTHLWLYDPNNNNNTKDVGLPMAPKTSPDIFPWSTIGFEVALQASNKHLDIYDTGGANVDSELGMAAQSSPSICP